MEPLLPTRLGGLPQLTPAVSIMTLNMRNTLRLSVWNVPANKKRSTSVVKIFRFRLSLANYVNSTGLITISLATTLLQWQQSLYCSWFTPFYAYDCQFHFPSLPCSPHLLGRAGLRQGWAGQGGRGGGGGGLPRLATPQLFCRVLCSDHIRSFLFLLSDLGFSDANFRFWLFAFFGSFWI